MPSAAAMQEFLTHRRIAVVGVSRDPKQFANLIHQAFLERGFEAIPVNPHATTLGGVAAYPTVQAIPAPVDGAILILPKSAHERAVDDCLLAGVPRIWFHSPGGLGTHPDLAARAEQAGVRVINGGCPFMGFADAGWFHRCHTAIARWTGTLQA